MSDNGSGAVSAAPKQKLIVHDDSANAHLFDTAKFEQCYRIARAMAMMSILPDHLRYRGNPKNRELLSPEEVAANCFRIVNQAIRWQMDPFAIVDETYVVAGKLGFQGKLVAAVVNSRAGLEGRLEYAFKNEGDNRTIQVSGKFPNDAEPKTIQVRVGDVKTDNQMWKSDPDQKLVYTGATKWARRHCPEVILGVLTEDDLDRIVYEQSRRVIDSSSVIERIEEAPATRLPIETKVPESFEAKASFVAEKTAQEPEKDSVQKPAKKRPAKKAKPVEEEPAVQDGELPAWWNDMQTAVKHAVEGSTTNMDHFEMLRGVFHGKCKGDNDLIGLVDQAINDAQTDWDIRRNS